MGGWRDGKIPFDFPAQRLGANAEGRGTGARMRGQDAGPGEDEDAAGGGKHQLAGKREEQTWKSGRNHVRRDAGRGNSLKNQNMAHCNQYFCRLSRTVYNKKRSIYKNRYPLLLVNSTSSLKHSFVGWGGEWDVFFFILVPISCSFFCCFSLPPKPHLNLPPSQGWEEGAGAGAGVGSGCGGFIAVWGRREERREG